MIAQKFEEVYSLFIQAKCSDVLSAEYIPAIEHAFVKLASLYPQIDFAGIKRRNACTVPETVTKERFTEIVRASVLSAEVVRYGNAVEQLRNDIDKLETVPDTWNKTKKEYAEKIKASLSVLRTQRDTSSKNLTAYRNDTLTPEQETDVIKAVNQLWETQNGIPTPEQIELRLSYLLDRAFTEESKEEQFYPTPDDIIQRYMLDYDINGTTLRTLLQSNDVQVLEPSAGRGNIADMIRAASPTATIDVCEINPLRREILTLKNYNVVGSDFTQFDSGEYYDIIVMNPPFNNGMDIRHVRRAYNMLKPGGVLIALLSEGSVWSNERKEVVAFRGWLERNTEYLHLDIIRREEYNVHHDRKILINIGIVQLQKKLQQAQTVTEKTSAKELLEKYQATAIDINSQQVEQDTTFVDAKVIVSNEELTQKPKYNYVPAKYFTLPFIEPHIFTGVNLAIESMNNTGGFLLADGTGAGKTMQCLLVAEHFYKTTGKPVLMFTVDDRVIQSGVFADAQKLGMETPDKIVIDENDTSKIPKRPKNDRGLYDNEDTDDAPTQVRLFRFGYKRLFPGINVCTYNELSTWQIVDKEMGQVAIAREKVKELDRRYKKLRQDLEAEGDAKFPKVNGKRTPTGYSDFMKAGKEELNTKYWNEPEHVELFQMQEALNQARKQAALLLIGDACLVIYDEAHKVKNVGKVGDATAARAEMGYAISTNVDNQMFVTATPADRAGDILYMRRAGLFANEDQFERLMNDIGYVWEKAAFNKNGQQVRAGYWKPINDYPQELIAEGMGRAFDTLTESGHMIRRELEMKNLDVQMHDIVVPQSVNSMMQAIEERLTPDEGRPNWGEIFLSQLIALEQYKLQQAIELTQEAISRGRSVIIWVSTVEEGKTETRATGELKPGAVQMLKNTLAKMYGEDKVGVIVGTKNKYEDYRRLENVTDFQSRKRRILIGTITSGGTGLNLDDTVGTAPRSMIVVTSPLSFINVVQAVGRIVRAKTKSRSECHFLFAQGIDVDAWLKNLLAMKFVTLNATVKGEMKALSISTMRQAENGGEDAIAALKTKDTSLQKTKHRLFSAKNMRYNGWELPGRFSIYVELSGTPKSTLISIGCKSKEQLDVWATENADFIKEYGLTVAPDENYRKYNGKYYGRKFHDRDYAECKNLWNACLNLVMPESFAYRTNTVAAFAENDVVRAAADLRFVSVAYGEQGTVTRVRKNMRTIDTKGTEVAEWFYDVDFGQDRHAKRLESRFLLNGEPKKQIIDVGMVFKNERKNSYDDGGSITTYTVIEADAYEVKFKRENRHKWKGNRYNYDTKSYYYESTSESEKEMFVEDVIKQIHAGELVCVQCGETTPPELTKPETVIEPDDVDVLADNNSICNKITEVRQLLNQAIEYDVLDRDATIVIKQRLNKLEETYCKGVTDHLPVIPILYGKETTIETPSGSIPAKYGIVYLKDVIASHNPLTWKPNPKYPLQCQQRDYEHDIHEQHKVLTNVANYDAKFTIVDVPTPDNGAPIITTQGITLGGNSRVMTLQYIGDVAGVQQYDKKYFNYLRGKFVEFGIDRGKLLRLLGGGEYFILVRIIDVPISQCATYNNTFNTNFTQEVDLVQKSVSYARQLGQDGIERIGNLFAENDTDYSDMVNDSTVRRQLVKILEDYNVITSQNKNQWLSYNNEFTDIGKLQLRNILLGAILPDKRYIETAKTYSDRLIKTVPQLIAIESLPKEYHISDYIVEVIKAESARRASGMDKKDFLNQTNFDAPELSQQSQIIWNALDSGINNWRKWVNKYLRIAKEESYRNNNDDMFGTKPLNQTEILEKLNSSSLSDDDFVPNSCPPVYPNGTRCITDDCIRQLDECIENEQPTKWKNWDGATNNYTAERLQLHQHIIDDFTKNKQCEPATTQPVAILTGGASGSGKSTLLKQYVPNIQDYVIIDIDKMREYLPEYKGWNANSTQEEVKDVYNKLFDTLGNPCRYNIIVDGTMNKAKSYKPILDKLRKLGYKVLIMYVKVTKEQSIQRAMSRYQKSGRYVPKFVIDEIFMNGTAAFDELKENSDGYILIDNSGAKPVVESQTTDTLGDISR